ncbi:aurora kinase A- and ninein-interacting protein [Rhynochetos jubatus]
MKRRGGAAQQAEACDVWLDTAELKQNAAQSLTAKPKAPSRSLERKCTSLAFTQPRASQPRTKQTTISTFFSAQAGEKDKENRKPSPFILNRDCKERGVSLAASAVKILALPQTEEVQKQSFRAETVQATAQRPARKAPASPTPWPDLLGVQAESHSKSEASRGAGEDCCFFTQDSEGNRIIAHRNESDLFAGEIVSASSSVTSGCGINKRGGQPLPEETRARLDFQPRPGAKQSKKPEPSRSVNSLTDFTETEDRIPAGTRGSAGAAGFHSPPQRPGRAQPLRERSQNAASAEEGSGCRSGLSSPCRQLFTQDSQGNRVIAHRCQSIPSPRRELPDSPRKGCASDAANRSLSEQGERWVDVGYESLFTQDSEGNRVIKHGYVTLSGSPSDLL